MKHNFFKVLISVFALLLLVLTAVTNAYSMGMVMSQKPSHDGFMRPTSGGMNAYQSAQLEKVRCNRGMSASLKKVLFLEGPNASPYFPLTNEDEGEVPVLAGSVGQMAIKNKDGKYRRATYKVLSPALHKKDQTEVDKDGYEILQVAAHSLFDRGCNWKVAKGKTKVSGERDVFKNSPLTIKVDGFDGGKPRYVPITKDMVKIKQPCNFIDKSNDVAYIVLPERLKTANGTKVGRFGYADFSGKREKYILDLIAKGEARPFLVGFDFYSKSIRTLSADFKIYSSNTPSKAVESSVLKRSGVSESSRQKAMKKVLLFEGSSIGGNSGGALGIIVDGEAWLLGNNTGYYNKGSGKRGADLNRNKGAVDPSEQRGVADKDKFISMARRFDQEEIDYIKELTFEARDKALLRSNGI